MSKIKHVMPFRSLLIILPVFFFSLVLITACDKVVDNNNNIVEKKGIVMNAAQENQTPAVVSSGTGTADVSYNKSTRKLSYTLTWANLTSDSIVGSHIHGAGTRAQNKPVVHGFTIPATRSGTYSGVADVDGVAIKEDSLLGGFYYFNIHTNRYRGGEIRGQIEF
jgi:hypothetical protein